MIVADALERWLEEYGGERWAPKVRRRVSRFAQGWSLIWNGGVREVEQLGMGDVRAVEEERIRARAGPAGMNSEGSYMRGFFKWAERVGLRQGNPGTVWLHRAERPRILHRTFSVEAEGQFCQCAENMGIRWLAQYVVVGITTGQREGTIRQLRWEWARRERGVVYLDIPGPVVKQKRALAVPVAPRALLVLGGIQERGLLIPDLPAENRVWEGMKRVLVRAGLDGALKPHDCRRTFVERCAKGGIPIEVCMKIGGWRKITTVLEYYYGQVPVEVAVKVGEVV